MREIKFRAFDKKMKVWADVNTFAIKPNGIILDRTPEQYEDQIGNFPYVNRELEPSQFTGLKDKNGKEIYEGDKIVAMYMGCHLYHGVVVFDEGSFCLKITNAKSNCKDYDVGSTPELNNFDSIKVIANIYENPELIVEVKA